MKRIVLVLFLVVSLTAGYSFAERQGHMMGSGMMGSPGYGESKESGEYGYGPRGMMGPGMMGYGMGPGMMGYGMGPGMMGYGGCGMMGPGMMGYGGCGMMGPGMMGYGMGPGMMGHHQMMHGMGPGMMGYGMGPGMMGYGMGPGMMGHHQMMHGMGPGMMGPGMMGGYGTKESQKFLDDTRNLRKKLHNKKFEYFEAARNPDMKREDISKLEKEILELQEKINKKWQR